VGEEAVTVVIVVIYIVGAGFSVYNADFCKKEAIKCVSRANRALRASDFEEADYWTERVNQWLRSTNYNLILGLVCLLGGIFFAVRGL